MESRFFLGGTTLLGGGKKAECEFSVVTAFEGIRGWGSKFT
jgi:hypothetical protein